MTRYELKQVGEEIIVWLAVAFIRATGVFLLLLMIGFLAGCATDQPPPPQIQLVAVLPDDDFIKDCDLQPPPDKDAYVKADANGREDMLGDAYKGATKDGIVCNARLKRVREWKLRQQQLYPSAASAAKP